jgi:hypothetical protein
LAENSRRIALTNLSSDLRLAQRKNQGAGCNFFYFEKEENKLQDVCEKERKREGEKDGIFP